MYKTLATGPIGVKANLQESIALAKAAGFEGLAVDRGQVQEAGGPDKLAGLLASAGLKPATADLPVDFRGEESAFQRDLAGLAAYAADLETLGCTRVNTWLMPGSDELPYEENLAQHARRLREIALILGARGVRLGLEYVGPKHVRAGKRYPFVYDQAGLFGLIDEIGQPNVGILLDCYHWCTSGGTAADLQQLSNESVVLVHVNDAPKGVAVEDQQDLIRRMPGETGVIDIGTFMQALVDMGYDGPVLVEPFSDWVRSLPPAEAVQATYDSLVTIWPAV